MEYFHQSIFDNLSSPAAVVTDSDAVQADDGEDAQGQSHDDDVKHFELWVEVRKTDSPKRLKRHPPS